MACRLVALDKRPRARPVGIGETFCWALAKLVMRAAGDQIKTPCGNLQLCPGLETDIEGATHDMEHCKLERFKRKRQKEEEAEVPEEEKEGGGIAATLNNLTIGTSGTEEEASKRP